MRPIDRDLIRGGHYGQRSREPHQQAEHMAAPTNAALVKKAPANSEPSTHGPRRHWAQIFNFRRPFQRAANGMNAFRRAIFETITFAGIIILAASVSPRIAAQSLVGIKMPSNNIYCMLETPYNDDGLRCDIREVTDSLPPQPASCQFAWQVV